MSPPDRQLLEPGISVDLQNAAEAVQMRRRPFGLAVRAVEVDGGRRVRPVPGAIVAHIDPEPPGLGPAAAGIEHRDRRIVGEQLARGEDMGGKTCVAAPPATSRRRRPSPARVERLRSTPWRAKICDWRYSGRWSQYLLTSTWAISPAWPALLRSAARAPAPGGSSRRCGSRIWGGGCAAREGAPAHSPASR